MCEKKKEIKFKHMRVAAPVAIMDSVSIGVQESPYKVGLKPSARSAILFFICGTESIGWDGIDRRHNFGGYQSFFYFLYFL